MAANTAVSGLILPKSKLIQNMSSVRGSPNGTIGGNVGTNGITNDAIGGNIGRTLIDIGLPLLKSLTHD